MTTALHRRLRLPGALVIGLGSMVGAGVFTSLGLAALLTGGRVGPLVAALTLAAVAAACNAVSTAQLAAVHPASGGAYVYGRRQLGPTTGFTAGWGFVTGKTASVAAMATTAGLYLFPGNALAARLTGVAAGVLFFAFAGYARVATMGEEVVDPLRTIPRAVLGALAVTVVLYGLLVWALVNALGGAGLAAAEAPVRAVLEAGLGASWGWVAAAAAVLASAGAMLNLLTGISRTSLAMAREGDLPRPLTRVGERTGTPWVGQLAVAAAVILLVLATDILTVVGVSSFGVLVYYAVANLSALTLRPEQRVIRAPRAVNVFGLVLCAVLALTLPPLSVAAMVGVFLVGLGGRAFVRSGRRGDVRGTGR